MILLLELRERLGEIKDRVTGKPKPRSFSEALFAKISIPRISADVERGMYIGIGIALGTVFGRWGPQTIAAVKEQAGMRLTVQAKAEENTFSQDPEKDDSTNGQGRQTIGAQEVAAG